MALAGSTLPFLLPHLQSPFSSSFPCLLAPPSFISSKPPTFDPSVHFLPTHPPWQVPSVAKRAHFLQASRSPLNKNLWSVAEATNAHLETTVKGDASLPAKWVLGIFGTKGGILTSRLNYAAYDIVCTALVLAGGYIWIRLFDGLVKWNVVEQKLSRKLMHISTGILFTVSWPLFSNNPWSRFYAVVVPFANILKLLLYGLGILKDEGLVKSISREGSQKELLRGPLYYVLVLSFCTVFFWRDSPVGMIALAMMCGGDGIADIVGRRIGGVKLPYNSCKSWAGSTAMFVFGFSLSLGFLYFYSSLGFFNLDWQRTYFSVALISLAATIVESLPLASRIDDNISVPLAAVLLGTILFPGSNA